MAKILNRRRLVPNIHLLEVHAPEVARKCRPGQFVMIMPDVQGRTPPPFDRRLGRSAGVGNLSSMECPRLDLGEPDGSGRRRPIPVPGSEFTVEVDPMTLATNRPSVFAGGDINRGGASVILAMGDARTAAAGIDRYRQRKDKS